MHPGQGGQLGVVEALKRRQIGRDDAEQVVEFAEESLSLEHAKSGGPERGQERRAGLRRAPSPKPGPTGPMRQAALAQVTPEGSSGLGVSASAVIVSVRAPGAARVRAGIWSCSRPRRWSGRHRMRPGSPEGSRRPCLRLVECDQGGRSAAEFTRPLAYGVKTFWGLVRTDVSTVHPKICFRPTTQPECPASCAACNLAGR